MTAKRAQQLVDAGVCLEQAGDVEGARKLYDEALRIDPSNKRAKLKAQTLPAAKAPNLPQAPGIQGLLAPVKPQLPPVNSTMMFGGAISPHSAANLEHSLFDEAPMLGDEPPKETLGYGIAKPKGVGLEKELFGGGGSFAPKIEPAGGFGAPTVERLATEGSAARSLENIFAEEPRADPIASLPPISPLAPLPSKNALESALFGGEQKKASEPWIHTPPEPIVPVPPALDAEPPKRTMLFARPAKPASKPIVSFDELVRGEPEADVSSLVDSVPPELSMPSPPTFQAREELVIEVEPRPSPSSLGENLFSVDAPPSADEEMNEAVIEEVMFIPPPPPPPASAPNFQPPSTGWNEDNAFVVETSSREANAPSGMDLLVDEHPHLAKPTVNEAANAQQTVMSVAKQPTEFDRLFEEAKEKIALDEHSVARELLRKCLAIEPSNSEIQQMIKHSEQTLLVMYESKFGKLTQKPKRKMKDADVIWLNLDHRAGFVLSQIDGTMSFEDVFSVSGMSRFDTAKILAQLIDEAVISTS